MEKRKPINDSAELFRRINRLDSEAEWTTDELREALREGGIDPDRLVNTMRSKVERLLNEERAKEEQSAGASPLMESASASAAPVSLLAELRERTGLPATEIALKMNVPVPFLSAVGRYPKVVPIGWRKELSARAENVGVAGSIVMNAFEHPYQAQMAASRDEAYAADEMTAEKILDQSGMDKEARQYWMSIATEG